MPAAHRLMWAWCGGLATAQVALAGLWLLTGGDPLVRGMIALLALEHLFMPAGIVPAGLAMREGRMTGTACVAGAQVVAQNLLTIRPWQAERGVAPAPLGPFVASGAPVVGIELVKALRLHADKLVIGGPLGPEALGLHFFAFNAGLGLATSVSQAFALVLLPHPCRAADRPAAPGEAMRLALGVLVPLVLAQAALARVCLPLLFGERWAGAASLVAVLCLMAVPQILWSGGRSTASPGRASPTGS